MPLQFFVSTKKIGEKLCSCKLSKCYVISILFCNISSVMDSFLVNQANRVCEACLYLDVSCTKLAICNFSILPVKVVGILYLLSGWWCNRWVVSVGVLKVLGVAYTNHMSRYGFHSGSRAYGLWLLSFGQGFTVSFGPVKVVFWLLHLKYFV